MNNDILALIRERAGAFSKGQRAIAAYITQSYDKAAFMTAGKLGKTVGVSESTVVRFAAELGFDGFPEMQKAMQEMVLNRLTSVQRVEVAGERFCDEDILGTVLQADIERLRRTQEQIDRADFSAAVEALLAARSIYIIGVRSASAPAEFLSYYLSLILHNVRTVTASGASEMFEKIIRVGAEDAVIAISFPRYSAATVKGAQYCRSAGASVIALTDSRQSPLGRVCDCVLQARSGMVSLVDSLVAPMSVINALLVAVAARRERELAGTLDSLEQVWKRYHVYEEQSDDL